MTSSGERREPFLAGLLHVPQRVQHVSTFTEWNRGKIAGNNSRERRSSSISIYHQFQDSTAAAGHIGIQRFLPLPLLLMLMLMLLLLHTPTHASREQRWAPDKPDGERRVEGGRRQRRGVPALHAVGLPGLWRRGARA